MQEKIKNFFESSSRIQLITRIICAIGIIAAIIVVFLAGESFGYRRAEFSYNFGENYNRMFEGRGMKPVGPLPFPQDNMFTNVHGAYGTIVKVALPTIVIAGDDGIEKTVIINNNSIIKEFRNSISSTTIRVGDMITVLGSPNENGQILATLIRIIPQATSTVSAQ